MEKIAKKVRIFVNNYGKEKEGHWNVNKILCAYFCPVYYQRMKQPIVIHVNQESYFLYKQIQEEILRIIAQKGIFVEVNLTSNTAISENRELFYASYFES